MRPETDQGSGANKRSRANKAISAVTFAVLGLAIFLLGISVGNGNIDIFSTPADKQNASLPEDLDYSSVERLYDKIRANYDGELKTDDLLDGILHGLASATGDPYTVYLNEEEAKEFTRELNGTFSGIGAELGLDDTGNLVIVSPIDGFPAQKAGLRPQDRIIGIDDESAVGLTILEAVNKIRGPKGTDVKLTVQRGNQTLEFTITRDDITIPSVESEIMDGNIGYMQVSQFGEDTASLSEKAAREFKDKNVKGVVLDLRGNPGGLLGKAIDLASLWLPKGETVLIQKRGDVTISTETSTGNDILRGIPTVVLINEGSASASEIVAGALGDNGAATLIGTKSYGKGSVQEIQPLLGGAELKVTVARWYRPNGENIDKKGVSPEQKIEITEEDYDQDRDPQLDAALNFLKN